MKKIMMMVLSRPDPDTLKKMQLDKASTQYSMFEVNKYTSDR